MGGCTGPNMIIKNFSTKREEKKKNTGEKKGRRELTGNRKILNEVV